MPLWQWAFCGHHVRQRKRWSCKWPPLADARLLLVDYWPLCVTKLAGIKGQGHCPIIVSLLWHSVMDESLIIIGHKYWANSSSNCLSNYKKGQTCWKCPIGHKYCNNWFRYDCISTFCSKKKIRENQWKQVFADQCKTKIMRFRDTKTWALSVWSLCFSLRPWCPRPCQKTCSSQPKQKFSKCRICCSQPTRIFLIRALVSLAVTH